VTAGSHRIRIVGGGESSCGEGERVLLAMERCGSSDIGVGCRSGGCGICRVRVVSGDYVTGKMSRSRITEQDEAAGLVLACRLYPRSDLILEAA
jgi:ferredoxin